MIIVSFLSLVEDHVCNKAPSGFKKIQKHHFKILARTREICGYVKNYISENNEWLGCTSVDAIAVPKASQWWGVNKNMFDVNL